MENEIVEMDNEIKITGYSSDFEREPLLSPFGFKGGYLTELWQNVSFIRSDRCRGIGLATQSVLYGDPVTFEKHSEASGNALMFLFSNLALRMLCHSSFTDPFEKTEALFPALQKAARAMDPDQPVSDVFILNSLVSVDNALWQLYYRERREPGFLNLLPQQYREALSFENAKVGVLFQVSYNMPVEEIVKNVDSGYFIIKIKIGQPGNWQEMLERDKARIYEIVSALKNKHTRQMPNGKLLYTLDANGRYPSVDFVKQLISYIRELGVIDQFVFFEEPLPVQNNEYVGNLGMPIGADESAMDLASAENRIRLGYSVIVLKPMAKTLSRSIQIAALAYKHNIPCVCSDLTVNPILVNWQKNLIARVRPFPGLGMALMETNGNENYKNWEKMRSYLINERESWENVREGVIHLDGSFWECNGHIFNIPDHYSHLSASVK